MRPLLVSRGGFPALRGSGEISAAVPVLTQSQRMGRGSRNTNDATAQGGGLALRPTALTARTPAWAEGVAATAAPAATAAANMATSNDAIRAILTGRSAQRLTDLAEAGPDTSGTRAERKDARRAHVRSLIEAASDAVRDQASTDAGWRDMLRAYAAAPDYSINNLIWAAWQLNRKGVDPAGVKLSRTAWNALGRQIKPEFEEPRGENRGAEWDSRYSVTMSSPTNGFRKRLDEIDPATGEKKEIFIPGSFTTFTAYHENATEAIGGGDAPPLPETPWTGATGSDADAAQLISDLRRICQYESLELADGDLSAQNLGSQGLPKRDAIAARYDAGDKRIVIDPSAGPAAQATAAVRAIAQHFGRPVETERAEKLGLDTFALDAAAADSAAYVIASLYGLDADEQAFPHLRSLAENPKQMSVLTGEVHHRVGRILDYMDPRRAAKAEHAAKVVKERAGTRRAKRSTQKKNKRSA